MFRTSGILDPGARPVADLAVDVEADPLGPRFSTLLAADVSLDGLLELGTLLLPRPGDAARDLDAPHRVSGRSEPDEVVATTDMDTGELVWRVLQLGAEDVLAAEPAALEVIVVATRRAISTVTALQQLALAAAGRRAAVEVAGHPGGNEDPSGAAYAAAEVAPLLRMAPRSAQSRVEDAMRLVDSLPHTLAAALAGTVDPAQTRAVVQSAPADPGAAREFDARLHATTPVADRTPARLRAAAERIALETDPRSAEEVAQQHADRRYVWMGPGALGMADWHASLPSARSLEAWTAIDELARGYLARGTASDIGAARADALLDLVLGQATVTTTVEVAVPTQTAEPEPGEPTGPRFGVRSRAGWLLSDEIGRLLAHPDTRVRLARLDAATGVSIASDTTAYRPNRALAQRVRARDRHCRFPGCHVPAERCDLDHVVPFPRGQTVETNLLALCRTHHGFKTHGRWSLRMSPDGQAVWVAPTGRTHATAPADRYDDCA